MAQQNKAGMHFRQSPTNKKKDTMWLVQIVAALLACIVLVFTVIKLTGAGNGNELVVMLAVSVWLCIVYGILQKTNHLSWFYIGVLVLVLLIIVVFRQYIVEGFRIFWNRASDAMVLGTGHVLPEWELQFNVQQRAVCALIFAGFAACVISILCCALVSFAPVILAVLLPAVLVAGMTMFGADGGFIGILPVLCVSVMILMYSGWRKKGTASPVIVSWIVCALLAVVLIFGTSLPKVQSWTGQISESVHTRIHEEKYETKYSTLPEGDFSDYAATSGKPKQALAVTMEEPQQTYLRGFTGAMFDGENWEALDSEVLVKNKQLLYWLNLNAFDQNAQFYAAAYTEMPVSSITVQNIGACSFYRYVPFCIGNGVWADAENLNTDGVYADGERNYTYSVSGGAPEDILQVVNYLQTSEEPAVLQYRKAESGYRQFIYHHYLQIPDEVKEILAEKWDEIASVYGGANNLTQQQAQECALVFLSECFAEDGTPEDIELPLEIAEGTTYQYATVAALTLRYFGIPARYAEGYVITGEMASEYESGETITVDSSCAKAWVEIYQDGVGWIPIDLTPGMSEMMENSENGNSGNGTSAKDITEKKEEEEKKEEQEQLDPTGGSMVRVLVKNVLSGLLAVIIVIALIFVALLIRRKNIVNRKEKKFKSENRSDAVAWIYADISILLEKLGFDRGNGSMCALTEPLKDKFGEEFAEQFELSYNLNNLAMFSSVDLEEEHCNTVMDFRNCALQKLNTEVKWYKRMWLKWVLCLY